MYPFLLIIIQSTKIIRIYGLIMCKKFRSNGLWQFGYLKHLNACENNIKHGKIKKFAQFPLGWILYEARYISMTFTRPNLAFLFLLGKKKNL